MFTTNFFIGLVLGVVVSLLISYLFYIKIVVPRIKSIENKLINEVIKYLKSVIDKDFLLQMGNKCIDDLVSKLHLDSTGKSLEEITRLLMILKGSK